ncbi:DoxX family membrane protein [Kitasatospora camelliae]|uniref:DoxX family membrane protein n=1 Tax=Kitasatospora camelliae TaxID=3156397 RepID=A0AAU8JX17_9ACTN
MDTRTPRRPVQGGPAGIDSGPGLNTVKVPSDPAKLSSTQASFRIRLGAPVAPMLDAPGAAFGDPYGIQGFGGRSVTPQVVVPASAMPALVGVGGGALGAGLAGAGPAVRGAAAAGGPGTGPSGATGSTAAPRRKPRVVSWNGQAAPGDLAATSLLEAVRLNTVPAPAGSPIDDTQPLHAVPRQSGSPETTPYPVPGRHPDQRPRAGGTVLTTDDPGPRWEPTGELPEVSATGDSRHAYPGRRVDLGLVLLPLRVLLGSLSVYAGFSKLCDPVYFDGGDRGSMMRWLSSLHPWPVAQPLLDFAMAHPVGSGLLVAFTEIVVGVLSILGLWQRVASGLAMALSAALLFTVSWRAVPVYDAPDLIFLAAWSPLLIAGAPFGSLDGRIALEAWRRLGSQDPGAVRRRVLRRRTVVTAVVVGLTLLVGSMLGAAVRTGRTQPEPTRTPTDFGSPMWPGNGPSPSPSVAPSKAPSKAPSTAPASPSPSPSKSGKAPASSKPTSGSTGHPPAGGSAGGTGTGGTGQTGGSTPRSTPSGGSLIGGVLGSGAPLLELGMPRTATGPAV